MPSAELLRAVGELAGQAQLARRGLALLLAVLAPAQPLLGLGDDVLEQDVARFLVAGQPVLEIVADDGLDQLVGLDADQLLLGLALELRLLDEHRDQRRRALDHVVGGDDRALAVAGQLGIALQAAHQGAAEARLVRAALGRRHGVAVGADEAFLVARPPHRPFDLAAGRAVGLALGLAGEGLRHDGGALADLRRHVVLQAAREVERFLLGDRIAFGQQALGAFPADLDATEQVGLGARHAIEALGHEGLLAEDLRIGMEGHRRAAPVGGGAGRLQLGRGLAAREGLRPGLAVARHLDDQLVAQRIHHRDADTVQAARGRVDLAVELAAGMQRREDDLQRRLVLELGVRVDRDAAPIVADQDAVALEHFEIDRVGVAGDGLVHGIVEHLGHKMMHGPFIGAADIHAGALADGFQPFQHLDVTGRVGSILGRGALAASPIEKIAVLCHASCLSSAARGDRWLAGISLIW